MARETIVIPVSREPLYEAVAVFLAVLAYPEPNQENRRTRFEAAWKREHLRVRADEDDAFAAEPQPIRPALFLMRDSAVEDEMREGASRLAERKEAIIATHQLFEAATAGERIDEVRGFGTELKNDAVGRATMTMTWKLGEKRSRNFDPKVFAKNLTTRIVNPSRPVIHAAMAYWSYVLEARRLGATTDADAERSILHNREILERVFALAEAYRHLAPSISELRVSENDLIEFRAA